MKKIKIGIIGCGAIGSLLAKAVRRDFSKQAALAFLCDIHSDKAARLKKSLGRSLRIVPIDRLIRDSDLVIEAASAKVSGEIAAAALKKHKDILVMSIGGLLLNDVWKQPAKMTRGRLVLPSGALAGIDALLAAKEGKIRSVRLITKKSRPSLQDAPYFKNHPFPSAEGRAEYCVFKGTAQEAVRGFPQNINVAALLSLAGLGPKKTAVEIRACESTGHNQHQVVIEAASGEVHAETMNVPSPENPKTSLLAAYSAIATLRKYFSTIKIGT